MVLDIVVVEWKKEWETDWNKGGDEEMYDRGTSFLAGRGRNLNMQSTRCRGGMSEQREFGKLRPMYFLSNTHPTLAPPLFSLIYIKSHSKPRSDFKLQGTGSKRDGLTPKAR